MTTPWDGKERRVVLQSCHQEVMARLDQLDEKIIRILKFIDGNGVPERGAVVRLDRLEQTKVMLVWLMAAVSVSVVGLIVKGIAEAMGR